MDKSCFCRKRSSRDRLPEARSKRMEAIASSLNDQDGAAEGKYRVLVQCRQLNPPSKRLTPVLLPSLIPAKYSDEKSSPLVVEVKAGVKEYPLVLE